MEFSGNDRGRPSLLDAIVPAFHYSNTPTRCSDKTPALRRPENLTQDSPSPLLQRGYCSEADADWRGGTRPTSARI